MTGPLSLRFISIGSLFWEICKFQFWRAKLFWRVIDTPNQTWGFLSWMVIILNYVRVRFKGTQSSESMEHPCTFGGMLLHPWDHHTNSVFCEILPLYSERTSRWYKKWTAEWIAEYIQLVSLLAHCWQFSVYSRTYSSYSHKSVVWVIVIFFCVCWNVVETVEWGNDPFSRCANGVETLQATVHTTVVYICCTVHTWWWCDSYMSYGSWYLKCCSRRRWLIMYISVRQYIYSTS